MQEIVHHIIIDSTTYKSYIQLPATQSLYQSILIGWLTKECVTNIKYEMWYQNHDVQEILLEQEYFYSYTHFHSLHNIIESTFRDCSCLLTVKLFPVVNDHGGGRMFNEITRSERERERVRESPFPLCPLPSLHLLTLIPRDHHFCDFFHHPVNIIFMYGETTIHSPLPLSTISLSLSLSSQFHCLFLVPDSSPPKRGKGIQRYWKGEF